MSSSHSLMDKDLQNREYIDNSENLGYLLGRRGPLLSGDDNDNVPASSTKIIKVPGDGNCGFYSIILGLLNLIYQDKIALTDTNYSRLFNLMRERGAGKPLSVLKTRLQYYKDGRPSNGIRVRLDTGCLAAIEEIINAIEENRIATFKQFKQFVSTHTSYYQVLALAISLAPSLRALSVDLYENEYKSLSVDSTFGEVVAPPKAKDGEYTYPEQLNLLSDFFNFHFVSYDVRGRPIMMGASYGTVNPPPNSDNLVEHEPLRGLAIDPLSSTPSGNSSVPEVKQEKEMPNPILPDIKPTIKLIYLEDAQHWELLLSESEFQSPAAYFGFDFNGIRFNFDAPPSLSAEQLAEVNNKKLKQIENEIKADKKIPSDQKKAQIEAALLKEKNRQEKEKQQELKTQEFTDELKRVRLIQHNMHAAKSQFQRQEAARQLFVQNLPIQQGRITAFKNELASLKTAINKIPLGKAHEYGLKAITALETALPKLCITSDAEPDQLREKQEAFTRCQQTITEAAAYYSTSRLSIAAKFANLGLLLLGIVPYLAAASWHYHKTGKVGFFHSPEPALKGDELPKLSSALNNLNCEAPSTRQLQPK